MTESISKTNERIILQGFRTKEEYILYLLHLFAYDFAKKQISNESLVLEVGCGEGYGASLLSQNVAKIFSLDIDKNTLAHASKKYGSENCLFRLYDGQNIPYNDNTFDAVISFQVIEHIKDDIKFLSEIRRVLKNNGLFIITTPNRTYRLKPGQKPLNEFHVREYYPLELQNLLKNIFPNTMMWGIRGNEQIQKIELERGKYFTWATLGPLNLRALIPKKLRRLISKLVRKIKAAKEDVDFTSKYSLKDCYIIRERLEHSLHILGICRK